MPAPTVDWSTVIVHNIYKDYAGVALKGARVIFTPTAERAVDQDNLTTIIGNAITVPIDETTGVMSIALPATDDPDIIPINFWYHVKEDFELGQEYDIQLPMATAGGVLELAQVAPILNAGTGTYYQIGPPGLVWKGAWASPTVYQINDAVTYLGSSYRRKVQGASATTPNLDATNWELLSAKGDAGDQTASDSNTWTGAVTLTSTTTSLVQIRTLSGNVTLSMPVTNPASNIALTVTLILKQAATGGPYTVTWPATLEWPNDAAGPAMPVIANTELMVHLLWTGVAWRGVPAGVYYP